MNDGDANIVKLAELLRHPDDLDKISGLKADYTRKKAAVDSQLKLGIKEQLQLTQSGMDAIEDGQNITNMIKEEMLKIDRLCAEAQVMIRNFPEINGVAQAHRNFAAVEKMKNDLESFQENLEELNTLIKEDDERLEDQPNLLAIHYGLTKLRNIRDDAMEQMKRAEDSSLEDTLQQCFRGLDDTIDDFNEHVGMIMGGMLVLVQTGNDGIVVRLAIIIEEEEKFDDRIKELRMAQQEFNDLTTRFKSLATGPKEIRGYKEMFLKSIKLHAEDQLESTNEMFNEDPEKLEKSLKWYFNELNTVKLGMTRLMPKKWKIFQTYTQIYHELLCNWLNGKVEDKATTTPSHMLSVIHWKEKYYEKMKRLGVPAKELEPPLPGGRDSDLVREYRQLIVNKVDQWVSQINKTDKQAFLERRDSELDCDEKNHFRTKTLGDLWLMLREQLIVASSSNLFDVTEGVTDAMFRALKTRQDMWSSLLTAEVDKYSKSGETEGMHGLQDWLVAIANDQILCIQEAEENPDGAQGSNGGYLDAFRQDYESLVSQEYVQSAAAKLDSVRDGLTDLMLQSISVFSRLIFLVDFRNVMTDFFTPAWFANQQLMGQIVSTYEDYLGDYTPRMPALLHDLLLQDLAKQLLIAYLQCVRNRGAKFRRSDPFVERLRDDVVTVFRFFEKQAPSAFSEIKAQWRVLEGFMGLLECDKHAIPAEFEKFVDVYWDVRMSWVEAVLRARDDVEFGPLGDGKNILKGLRAAAAERRGTRDDEETIMSQVD